MADRRSTLESVITTAIATQLKSVHTMLPGQIINFNPNTQLADIQPQLKKKVNGELINLPVMSQVPVRFLKSKDFVITFPLKEEDEVALYVIERSIDSWLIEGGIQSPDDVRRFDLTDAYAVPILYSQKEVIADFDPDNMVIKSTNGNSKIILKADGSILMETTGNTEITSAKTIINNDLEVTGTITAPTVKAATSLTISGVELKAHTHGGVTAGGDVTSPLA